MRMLGLSMLSAVLGFVSLAALAVGGARPGPLFFGTALIEIAVVGALLEEMEVQHMPALPVVRWAWWGWWIVLVGGAALWMLGG